MSEVPALLPRSLSQKYWRLRRHIIALIKYATPFRLVNLLRLEAERISGRTRLKGRPYIIVIDPINVCNLKCPFCPTGYGGLPLKPGRMELDLYKMFIDQIARHTIKLILYNWGEPFLHKDILSMIRYAHRKRIATVISTNLNVMPTGGAEAIVKSGLDDLIISCDGLSQRTYEIYRRGGDLSRVVANLQSIAEAKSKLRSQSPVIEFQYLVFRHNEHEVGRVESFAKDRGADFVRICKPYLNMDSEEVKPATNPAYVRNQYLDATKSQSPDLDIFSPGADQEACVAENPPPLKCFWPWRSMVINWNGQVDPCCGKNYLSGFGNVFEAPFEKIWNGPLYRYARGWIKGRRKNDKRFLIVCRGCPGYEG